MGCPWVRARDRDRQKPRRRQKRRARLEILGRVALAMQAKDAELLRHLEISDPARWIRPVMLQCESVIDEMGKRTGLG